MISGKKIQNHPLSDKKKLKRNLERKKNDLLIIRFG
jgi:hypothetical protein